MRKNLCRQFTEQLRLITLRQFLQIHQPYFPLHKSAYFTYLKHTINAFPSRIPHSTQSIPGHSPSNSSRKVRNDESHGTTTQTPNHTPELARRMRLRSLRHTLLPQHLLEHATKLLIAEVLFFRCVLRPEAEGRPRESSTAGTWWWAGYFFLFGIGSGEGMVGASRVVVAPARAVREGVVGVVYLLEFLGAGRAFRGVGGDAVGVRL